MRVHLREMKTLTKTVKLGELNKCACEDLILSINTSASVGKIAFSLVKNAKSENFLERNCKVEWGRLVRKGAPCC